MSMEQKNRIAALERAVDELRAVVVALQQLNAAPIEKRKPGRPPKNGA